MTKSLLACAVFMLACACSGADSADQDSQEATPDGPADGAVSAQDARADAAHATRADAGAVDPSGRDASPRDASPRDASTSEPADARAKDASVSDASSAPSDAGQAPPPVPSAGCGKGARPASGVVSVANDHIYNFPSRYDGNEPLPMLLALHANGNPNTQLQGITNGSRLDANFIRVFPKSAGQGWVMATDAPRIARIYEDVLANYCVDTSRVFLTGHSSGAQMAVQMLCAASGEKRFKAVAPVAASKYCAKVTAIPVMYIQGKMDAQRGNGNGSDVVSVFATSNGCSNQTAPDTSVPTCTSSFDRAQVTPGCVRYQGCSQPTIWCSHNDNGYNNSDGRQHGFPCFASNAMADFFLSLP